MLSHTSYLLSDGVQVRKEIFGLLFYDYRGPRLYFVPTQDLIPDEFFAGRQTTDELVESIKTQHNWPRQWIEGKIDQVLSMLQEKGLIYGQSVC